MPPQPKLLAGEPYTGRRVNFAVLPWVGIVWDEKLRKRHREPPREERRNRKEQAKGVAPKGAIALLAALVCWHFRQEGYGALAFSLLTAGAEHLISCAVGIKLTKI